MAMANISVQGIALSLFIVSSILFEIKGAAVDEPRAEAIIGGDDAIRGKWGEFASIRLGQFRCGAVLIREDLILTAKHCVSGKQPYELDATVNDYLRMADENSEQKVGVVNIFLHDTADLAVVQLSCSVQLINDVKVAQLYTGSLPPEGTMLQAIGFGWTRSGDGTSLADTLQEVSVPVANNFLCTAELGENGGAGVRTYEFCAGFDSGTTYINVCHGDSGGPIFYEMGGTFYLAGIIVRGPKYCPHATRYAVFITLSDTEIKNFVEERLSSVQFRSPCIPTVELSPPKEEKKDCFPGDATVVTDSGLKKQMKDVKRGDKVLAMTPEGTLVYSDIIMMMHSNKHMTEEFYVINTGDEVIHMSDKHMIYTQGKNEKEPGYKFAENVQEGDFVFTGQNAGTKVQKAIIISIQKTRLQGVFAPMTQEGTIVVDHVIASCYAYVESHSTCHAVFYPARVLHTWLPGSLGWGEPTGETSEEDFRHWYPHLVATLTSPALTAAGIMM